MSFNFNGNLDFTSHIATWLDSSLPNYPELKVNYETFNSAYKVCGFRHDSTHRMILYSTSYFNGLWASEKLGGNSGYACNGTDLLRYYDWAAMGSAPLPCTDNGLVWPNECFVAGYKGHYPQFSTASGGLYLWIAYFDGTLQYCQTTSKTPPAATDYIKFGVGNGCNVVIITLVGGGGGGGGGHASNPVIGSSSLSSGGGGGGGGYYSFLYKFNKNTKSSGLTSSYKVVITLGEGGTGGKAATQEGGNTGASKGGTGGTTKAEEYTTYVTSKIAEAYGGAGGSGGNRSKTTNPNGGAGGSNGYVGTSRSCHIQKLTGCSGGKGRYLTSSNGSGKGSDGESFPTDGKFSFYSNGRNVCEPALIRQGFRGTGSPAGEYVDSTAEYEATGGGGGASPYSCSTSPSNSLSEFLGTGGQGGGASCIGSSDYAMRDGADGYPGCCSITFN